MVVLHMWNIRCSHGSLLADLKPKQKTVRNQSHRRFFRGFCSTETMQASIFNIRVPLKQRDDVFLVNTLTDAQLVVSPDVAALLDRTCFDDLTGDEREAVDLLSENGFFVADYATDRQRMADYFHNIRHSREELHVTVL